MNHLKDKLRTKSFWLSIAAGVVLILQTLGIKVDAPYVNEIIETVSALLVLVGVFTAPIIKPADEKDKNTGERETDKKEQGESNAEVGEQSNSNGNNNMA